ncbi:MAG: hypothetical protein COA78_07950 [Blastopirellula sp.]|nr:MAG: hypothetical protein COA78_07950 [Blastopirellula sp.]
MCKTIPRIQLRSFLLSACLLLGCQAQDRSNQPANTTTSLITQDPSSRSNTAEDRDTPRQVYDIDDSTAIESRISEDITFLASDEMQGRGIYTQGLEKSAVYIADEFTKLGLQVDTVNGSPYQVFRTKTGVALGEKNFASLVGPSGKKTKLRLNTHFTPLSLSSSGQFDLALAFAGYAIQSTSDNYDDFSDFDVTGKAVIVLRHEPIQGTNSNRFNGSKNSSHAYLTKKVQTAIANGAAAVILCTDQVAIDKRAARASNPKGNENLDFDSLLNFKVEVNKSSRTVPVLHCRREMVDQLLQAAGKPSLTDLELQIDENVEPQAFALPECRIEGEFSIQETKQELKNVIAVLPGKGPNAEETIVVGAHYDHLGMGGGGSLAPWTVAVHNGADDNASGTTGLMEIARQLVGRLKGDHRRILFIAFSAEEQGLLGSAYYVKQPLVPIDKTVAMFNLDMVGRLREDKLTLYGTGTAKEFPEMVKGAAEKHSLDVSMVSSGYGPSDHASFYGKGVPVFHFFTGYHSDYHRPSDDSDKVNVTGVRRIVQMATDMLLEIATADTRPTAVSSGSILDFYLPTMPSRSNARKRNPSEPELGVTISLLSNADGLRIDKVSKGSTADRGQLKPGDIIREVNGEKVQTVVQLREQIKTIKLGETLPFIIRRGSIDLEFEIKF